MVGIAFDGTLRMASQSQAAAQELGHHATATSWNAYSKSQNNVADTTGRRVQETSAAVVVGTTQAAKFTGETLHDGAVRTRDFVHDVADETMHLLPSSKTIKIPSTQDWMQATATNLANHLEQGGVTVAHVTATTAAEAGKVTISTTNTAGQVLVHQTAQTTHFIYDTGLRGGHVAIDPSQLAPAANKTYRIVETCSGTILVVANRTIQLAMDNMQKLVQLNPIVIFKRVVRLVLNALLYTVISAPVAIWALGKVLWKLGIQPLALEAIMLAWFLAIVIAPSVVFIRWRALEQLDRAGGELVVQSMQNSKPLEVQEKV